MKVWPKNNQLRKVLRHPSNNVPFHADGPLEWPDDSFTHRRVQDGDVLLKDPAANKPEHPAEAVEHHKDDEPKHDRTKK